MFTLFYSLFAIESAFGFNDLSEYKSKDSNDYDKPRSIFGLSGI